MLALALQEPDLSDVDRSGRSIAHDEHMKMLVALRNQLESYDAYQMVFNPLEDDESIQGSLADDLADVYRDLKDGLIQLEADPASTDDVVWKWRFLFQSHWGHHAVAALNAIHWTVYDDDFLDSARLEQDV